jgi:hypothetical protein
VHSLKPDLLSDIIIQIMLSISPVPHIFAIITVSNNTMNKILVSNTLLMTSRTKMLADWVYQRE